MLSAHRISLLASCFLSVIILLASGTDAQSEEVLLKGVVKDHTSAWMGVKEYGSFEGTSIYPLKEGGSGTEVDKSVVWGVEGVPQNKYTQPGQVTEIWVDVFKKMRKQNFGKFIAFSETITQKMEEDEKAKTAALARAKEAAQKRQQARLEQQRQAQEQALRQKLADERAAAELKKLEETKNAELQKKLALIRAEDEARRRHEEEQARKKKEADLEAQPPQDIIGSFKSWVEKDTMVFSTETRNYTIHDCKKICLDKETKINVKIRRVEWVDANNFKGKFVSWDPAFLKEYNKLLESSKSIRADYKDKIVDLDKELNDLNKEISTIGANIEAIDKKHPLFIISGEPRNRDSKGVFVWGIAVGFMGDFSQLGALPQKSNIYVVNPKTPFNNLYYKGEHYFLKKGTGTNAFGAKVPVWIYGDMPSKSKERRKELIAELEPLQTKYEKIEARKTQLEQALNSCVIRKK